jgi:hypothetical protein
MTEHSGASANKRLASEYTPLFPEGGREVVVILEAQVGPWEMGGGHAPLEGWPTTAAFRVRRFVPEHGWHIATSSSIMPRA